MVAQTICITQLRSITFEWNTNECMIVLEEIEILA